MKKMRQILLVGLGITVLSVGASAAAYLNKNACVRHCEAQMDKTQNMTQSAAAVKQYEACIESCNKLESAQNEFKKCIQNAKDDKDKEKCRHTYMENRPSDL